MVEMLRFNAVITATGYPRGSIYEQIKRGTFPKPVSMGMRTAAWPKHEVEKIMHGRIAGKSEDEIKLLVRQIHADRQSIGQAA